MGCLKINVLVFIIMLSLNSAHQSLIADNNSHDWDILMFSQHWPETLCKSWKQRNSKHHCRFPLTKNRWTVHGIWPTKLKTDGPSFCNDSLVFDPEQIRPIEKDLEQAWTNIFKGSSTHEFWAHEWNKHGTCGLSIKDLNSQHKYFTKGILWNKKYYISDMFSAANIIPSNVKKLSFEFLSAVVKFYTSKQPEFTCWRENGVQYLDEVRLCFDKQLKITDCPDKWSRSCDHSKGLVYPVWSNE